MDGTPVGRRVFLGVLGVGAVGILWGAKAQDWLERTVSPIIAKPERYHIRHFDFVVRNIPPAQLWIYRRS